MAEAGLCEGRPVPFNWTYRRSESDERVEFGTVRGRDVALPAHFHDEDQITLVLRGRRRFFVGGDMTSLDAGGCALIPAGSVHRSLLEPGGVEALNIYVPAGDYMVPAMMRALGQMWREGGWLDPNALVGVIQGHRLGWRPQGARSAGPRPTVTDLAVYAGLSREGFSRAFARTHGMPPHAFGLVARLNHARRLLRGNV
jgi:AraC-like DNA-binding protein